jgi:hypothetical protein
MKNRAGFIAGAITLALLLTGIAWAAQDAESNVNVSLAENQDVRVPVNEAGVVLLHRANGSLEIISVTPNNGYTAEVEVAVGAEVEAEFRGNGQRVQFNAELEDGIVRIRIRTKAEIAIRSTASTVTTQTGSTSTSAATSTSTSTTLPTETTSTTVASTSTTAGAGIGLPVGTVSYDLNGAGSVTVLFANETILITSINPAAGWSVATSEEKGDEIDVRLTNGNEEAELRVRIESGQLRVEVKRNN